MVHKTAVVAGRPDRTHRDANFAQLTGPARAGSGVDTRSAGSPRGKSRDISHALSRANGAVILCWFPTFESAISSSAFPAIGKGCQSKPGVSPRNSLKTNGRWAQQVSIFRDVPETGFRNSTRHWCRVETPATERKQTMGTPATRHCFEGVSERDFPVSNFDFRERLKMPG